MIDSIDSNWLLPVYEMPVTGPVLLKIVIPGDAPKSMNTFWGGISHRERTKYKNYCRFMMRGSLPDDIQTGDNPRFPYKMGRVDILERLYMKGNVQDPDNVCLKAYIDAVTTRNGNVSAVIEDDSSKFIRYVVKNAEHDRENPRIEITFHIAFESEAQVMEWFASTDPEPVHQAAKVDHEMYGMFSAGEVSVSAPLTKMEVPSDQKNR